MTRYYNVGKIVNTHGLKGEVRVITVSDFKEERYRPGNELYVFTGKDHSSGTALIVHSHRVHKQFDLLTFEEHTKVEDVQRYKGGWLKVREEDRAVLEEDEYYFDQIIGCNVYLTDGEYIGVVTSILTPGANDVWVVQLQESKREVFIPYVEEVVKDVLVQEQRIIIDPIEGLLE